MGFYAAELNVLAFLYLECDMSYALTDCLAFEKTLSKPYCDLFSSAMCLLLRNADGKVTVAYAFSLLKQKIKDFALTKEINDTRQQTIY